MNKLTTTLIFVAISVFSYGQGIIVESTNKDDFSLFAQYKSSPEITSAINKLKAIINANPNYAEKNMSVVVKVIFYDPAINILKLQQVDIYSDLYIWGANTNNTGNQIVLNFIFTEELSGSSKKITFTKFQYQESGNNEQIPELVENYIQEKILKQQHQDVEIIVKKGLNAVKNAFDRRFMNKMPEIAENMMREKKYYKGYSYATYPYYGFQSEQNLSPLGYDFCDFYIKKTDEEFIELLYDEENISVKNTVVASILSGKRFLNPLIEPSLIYYDEEKFHIKDNKGNFVKYASTGFPKTGYIVVNNTTKSDIPVKAQNDIDFIIKNPLAFSHWDSQKVNAKWSRVSIFRENTFYCDQSYFVKLTVGVFESGELVYTWNGIASWAHFAEGQATWCNQFARDLSAQMYLSYLKNKNGFEVLRNTGSDGMYDDFNNNRNKYVDITDFNKEKENMNYEKPNQLWSIFVDKGYLVFYSYPGHIETCFPNNLKTNSNKYSRTRHIEDIRYNNVSNTSAPYLNKFVGAGSSVGYKKQTDEWIKKAKAFLYLEYLGLEFE